MLLLLLLLLQLLLPLPLSPLPANHSRKPSRGNMAKVESAKAAKLEEITTSQIQVNVDITDQLKPQTPFGIDMTM